MKITIDEGFFGFFFDLGAKKKRPAGEAIEIENISFFIKHLTKSIKIHIIRYVCFIKCIMYGRNTERGSRDEQGAKKD